MRRDTTDPATLALSRPLALIGEPNGVVEAAAQFRLIPHGFYHAVVGPEWSSKGREECDQLHHLDIVVAGAAQIRHAGKAFELRPGGCDWLPGNAPVSRECAERYECYYLTFRCEWIAGIDLLSDWAERRPIHLGTWDVAAWREAWEERPLSANTMIRTLATVTAKLSEHLPDLSGIIARHDQAATLFPRVFAYLAEQAELGRAMITVADLAAVHGTTPGAFAKAFTRAMGINPKTFLQRRANQAACTLLRSGDLPIKAIADQLGFADPFYFSRWFSATNGVSPGRYRANL